MRNTRESGQILRAKKRPRLTLRSGRESRANSNTSRQIPARVIEADGTRRDGPLMPDGVAGVIHGFGPWPMWMLGYPAKAVADLDRAPSDARETGQVAALMYVLGFISPLNPLIGNYAAAAAQGQELLTLAKEKGASFWISLATTFQGCVSASTGKPADAVQLITSGLAQLLATGTTFWLPLYYPFWHKLMPNSANPMTRCVALAKRCKRYKQQRKRCSRPRSIAWRAKSS